MIKLTNEERQKLYENIIIRYLEKTNLYDFVKFVTTKNYNIPKDLNKALNYAKDNLPKELYEKFYQKVFPFESVNKSEEEVESLKKTVIRIANEIDSNKANLIDIVENVDIDINNYLYLLNQLRFKYKCVSATTYTKNNDYLSNLGSYMMKNIYFDVSFPDLTVEEDEMIKNIIFRNNLPFNGITYHEAYRYAMNHKLITRKNNTNR